MYDFSHKVISLIVTFTYLKKFNFYNIQFEKPDKCEDVATESFFDPIELADISTNEISDSTVWHLADQNDIEKNNQIFYVTYQDPSLGNKTLKLVNQVVIILELRL